MKELLIDVGNYIRQEQILGMLIMAKERLLEEFPMLAAYSSEGATIKVKLYDKFRKSQFKVTDKLIADKPPELFIRRYVDNYHIHYINDVTASGTFAKFVDDTFNVRHAEYERNVFRRIHEMPLENLDTIRNLVYPLGAVEIFSTFPSEIKLPKRKNGKRKRQDSVKEDTSAAGRDVSMKEEQELMDQTQVEASSTIKEEPELMDQTQVDASSTIKKEPELIDLTQEEASSTIKKEPEQESQVPSTIKEEPEEKETPSTITSKFKQWVKQVQK